MPSLESPLNAVSIANKHIVISLRLKWLLGLQAHQHAANADEFMNQGLLIPASEEHYKAAEAFAACIIASSEENVCHSSLSVFCA